MKIHEYQAKDLLRAAGVRVPSGQVAMTPEEAGAVAQGLPGYPVLVKAQIQAGGRGKGGGVVLAHDEGQVEETSRQMLGMTLVTKQTGPDGRLVSKVLVEEGLTIARELYLAILVDRAEAAILVMVSSEGGMDIEEVAASDPEKILKLAVNPLTGLQGYHWREAAFSLGLTGQAFKSFGTLLSRLCSFFVDNDCSLVEINPLVVTGDGEVVALDAKVELDGSGLVRHPELALLRDEAEEDPLEVAASRFDLNYIKLQGNVGNMVNGAGLAMATMDIIKQAGAAPANFLDVGGGANAEMVENGMRIILSDANVEAILVNIFGGILRCDVLAAGLVQAAAKVELTVPVVVRMEGTNVEEGRRILAQSDLELITAHDLADAAAKVAAIVGQGGRP
ncbi:MAG: ADP-forming succinate--CoA ligase subunit beta [Thermodesulfobacteriota bacterium]